MNRKNSEPTPEEFGHGGEGKQQNLRVSYLGNHSDVRHCLWRGSSAAKVVPENQNAPRSSLSSIDSHQSRKNSGTPKAMAAFPVTERPDVSPD
jgi:hypothetical protein